MRNDYTDYIAHKDHKYFAKAKVNGKTRYFYTKAEYNAFMNGRPAGIHQKPSRGLAGAAYSAKRGITAAGDVAKKKVTGVLASIGAKKVTNAKNGPQAPASVYATHKANNAKNAASSAKTSFSKATNELINGRPAGIHQTPTRGLAGAAYTAKNKTNDGMKSIQESYRKVKLSAQDKFNGVKDSANSKLASAKRGAKKMWYKAGVKYSAAKKRANEMAADESLYRLRKMDSANNFRTIYYDADNNITGVTVLDAIGTRADKVHEKLRAKAAKDIEKAFDAHHETGKHLVMNKKIAKHTAKALASMAAADFADVGMDAAGEVVNNAYIAKEKLKRAASNAKENYKYYIKPAIKKQASKASKNVKVEGR